MKYIETHLRIADFQQHHCLAALKNRFCEAVQEARHGPVVDSESPRPESVSALTEILRPDVDHELFVDIHARALEQPLLQKPETSLYHLLFEVRYAQEKSTEYKFSHLLCLFQNRIVMRRLIILE